MIPYQLLVYDKNNDIISDIRWNRILRCLFFLSPMISFDIHASEGLRWFQLPQHLGWLCRRSKIFSNLVLRDKKRGVWNTLTWATKKKNILLLSLQFRMAYEIIPTYLANLLCTQNNQTRGPFFSLLTCMSHLTSYLGWLLDWTNDLEKLQPKHQWLRVYVSVALVTIQHWGGHFATRCFFVGGVTSKSFRVMGEKRVTSYHYHASESLWSWNWKTKMTR